MTTQPSGPGVPPTEGTEPEEPQLLHPDVAEELDHDKWLKNRQNQLDGEVTGPHDQ